MKIEEVHLDRLEVPLLEPYRLSTVTVESFDVVLVRVEMADGSLGFGEVTLLEEYSEEEGDRAWKNLHMMSEAIAGTRPDVAVSKVEAELEGYPFSTTGLVSAVETASNYEWSTVTAPIVGICSADDSAASRRNSLRKQLDEGIDTVKVKIGFDPDSDAAVINQFAESSPTDVSFRVDANQGYSLAEARRFLSLAPIDRLDHVEQPLPVDNLDEHATLAAESHVDVVLDEDVTTEDDIDAVYHNEAADGVKFKLMKCGGLNRARRLIADARERGFTVIFGNGVQSDVGCILEASLWEATGLETAGEFNGWRKQSANTLQTAPGFQDGHLHWSGLTPVPDEAALDRFRLDSAHFEDS